MSYANEAKVELLGVPPDLIETHGAVSPEVAAAMAEGVRNRLGATSGSAPPGSPVPRVVRPKSPSGSSTWDFDGERHPDAPARHRLDQPRDIIQSCSSKAALNWVRLVLTGEK